MEENEMRRVDLVVIGGSAGSFTVLLEILPKIRTDIDFAIVVILHRKNNFTTSIADVFDQKCALPVLECEDKDRIEKGKIYFAPADYHLLIEKDSCFSLDYSEKVNFSRPAIDITFKNAADVYESKLVGILLSGANADGAEGLAYIKQKSGTTIVQDPESAEIATMPNEALKLCKPDFIANVGEIADLINQF